MITKDRININSIIIGLYLSIPMLTKIFTSIIGIENNIVILIGILSLCSLYVNFRKLKIDKIYIITNILIAIFFTISFISLKNIANTTYYALSYILYGIVATGLIQQRHRRTKIFETINLTFVVYTIVLIINYIPNFMAGKFMDSTMDISYTSLIGVISVLLMNNYISKRKLKALDRKNSIEKIKSKRTIITLRIIIDVALLINIIYLFTLNNNRGTIAILIAFIFIMLISRIKRLSLKIIFCILTLLIVILSFNSIINIIGNSNININWLKRFAHQIETGNITSNRNETYEDAIKAILEKPILGNGIGKYENDNDNQYTHNIFLQFFCEFGIPIGVVLGILVIKYAIITIFNNRKTVKDSFALYVMIQSLPRLMISSVYWVNSFFWIFMYYAIRRETKIIKRKMKKI